ncbi:RanBP-type and C3HC4-type zinc finger-containing protein 1 [Chamberlinius hualienensis]
MSNHGWQCPFCTYLNFPTRPGCEMCTGNRPVDYQPPEDYIKSQEELLYIKRQKQSEKLYKKYANGEADDSNEDGSDDNYVGEDKSPYGPVRNPDWLRVIQLDDEPLASNEIDAECPVCFELVPTNGGIKLKECFHTFCQSCLREHIQIASDPIVQCPQCSTVLQEREIRALAGADGLQKLHARSMTIAEKSSSDPTFHCKTVDCSGWCYYDDNVNTFDCPVCKKKSCITCRAQHREDCKTYQQNLTQKALNNDDEAIQTQQYFMKLISAGEALHCPACNIVLSKKDGCDWICCPNCRLEICWVTKGPRWGPLVFHIFFLLLKQSNKASVYL